jgi:uncharacterized protein
MRISGLPNRWLWLLAMTAMLYAVAGSVQAALDFPELTGRVVDGANLLSAEDESRITQLLKAHEEKTTNQVVVVTLRSLQGYDIADYGYQLGRHWGIGQAEQDNGVLLIVAPNERKVRIEVGYGLEATLTDALSKQIIDKRITPQFKKKDYPGGIQNGVGDILGVLDGSADVATLRQTLSSRNVEIENLFNLVIITIILGGVLAQFMGTLPSTATVFASTFGLGSWFGGSIILGLMAALFASVFHLLSRLSGSGGGGGYGGGSSGGYSGGGGGFSGGGGSFGGGGASGGW